jgi:hypothetical protein
METRRKPPPGGFLPTAYSPKNKRVSRLFSVATDSAPLFPARKMTYDSSFFLTDCYFSGTLRFRYTCRQSQSLGPASTPPQQADKPVAQFWCNLSPFRINTSKSVSKQRTLTSFRINTYEKQGEEKGHLDRGPLECGSLLPLFPSSKSESKCEVEKSPDPPCGLIGGDLLRSTPL